MEGEFEVTFYTRAGCHLCTDAERDLSALSRQFGFRVQTVDISKDPEALKQWWADIPVVVVGSTVLKAPLDSARLRLTLLDTLRARM